MTSPSDAPTKAATAAAARPNLVHRIAEALLELEVAPTLDEVVAAVHTARSRRDGADPEDALREGFLHLGIDTAISTGTSLEFAGVFIIPDIAAVEAMANGETFRPMDQVIRSDGRWAYVMPRPDTGASA